MNRRLVDALFHLAHGMVVGFSGLGWIFATARPWHLLLQTAIGISWFVLGRSRGWGYCWLTDQQWRFKERHGKRPKTGSFVEYWINDLLHLGVPARPIQSAILWTWVVTSLASLGLFVFA
jgi:hypothetical protein